MELKNYIAPLLKYWWLLVLAGLVSSVSSFFIARQQPPIYQTRTTMIMGQAMNQMTPTTTDVWLIQFMANYYADIAQRQEVRQSTMDALGLEWLPEYSVRPLPNNPLLEIWVTDSSPIRAQAVANELANQLILQSPAGAEDEGEQQAFIEEQLAKLQAEITKTEEDITAQQEELAAATSARRIAEIQADIDALRSKLTVLQSNYASLVSNTDRGATNVLTVIEPAALPMTPIGPNVKMIVLLSTAIAMLIAAGGAYLLEYIDDTFRTPEEITHHTNLPVLGYLSEMGKGQNEAAYVARKPRSRIAEAFRSLRINLDFVGVDEPLKTILVTSANVGEGKTSIAANLAIVYAQGGKKVVVVDADLRKPSLHTSLGLQNEKGLSDIFLGYLELKDVMINHIDHNLFVIPAGTPPPNPTDLLGSKRMDSILESIKAMADVVIVDGPPFLVPDAVVLSTKVDGVLLVVRHAHTRRDGIKKALEQLNRAGARMVGVALNRLPRHSEDYSLRYRHYSHYYEPEDDNEAPLARNGRLNHLSLFREAKKAVQDSNHSHSVGEQSTPDSQSVKEQPK